jgi:hypothetical protein
MGRVCKGTVSAICRLALIGACIPLITGCGPFDGADSSESGSSTTASATDLAITVWPQGKGRSRQWTLRCDPVGGSLPNAATACAQLTAEALRPLPRDTICTQIYGGPQTIRVTGELDGRAVKRRFARTNGCEIAEYARVARALPMR